MKFWKYLWFLPKEDRNSFKGKKIEIRKISFTSSWNMSLLSLIYRFFLSHISNNIQSSLLPYNDEIYPTIPSIASGIIFLRFSRFTASSSVSARIGFPFCGSSCSSDQRFAVNIDVYIGNILDLRRAGRLWILRFANSEPVWSLWPSTSPVCESRLRNWSSRRAEFDLLFRSPFTLFHPPSSSRETRRDHWGSRSLALARPFSSRGISACN